ncbi:GtrA family protein [Pontibacter beigongshangensis]|uniref:GtrA family protein n=1 Tax=Pontibacter beigongshangensis TaxID=2574733 RepID=UPI001F50F9D2|nr:GtrA family protein [Pontibacter beigongshangensis]
MKFGLVGLSGTALDFGVTHLAKEKLLWNKYMANTMGFVIAVTNNFFLNRYWTFHNHDQEVGWQFSKFMSVALLGLVFHTLLLYLFSDKARINFYQSKLGATIIVFVWNFFLNYFFTF